MMIDILIVVSILIALWFLGYTIAIVITTHLPRGYRLSIAFPLGSGLSTCFLFLLSWTGIQLDAKTVVLCYSGLLLAMILTVRVRLKDEHWKENGFNFGHKYRLRSTDILPVLMITTLTLIASYLAISRSYSTWDAMGIWSIKGIGIAYEGTIYAARHWGSHGLSYPLNIPLQISLFRIFGEDALSGSKLIFPMYYFSLVLGSYYFLEKRAGWKRGFLGSLFLGTIPIIFEHATIGYANLPFTTYLALGLMSVMTGTQSRDKKRQILGGLLLGLASWTRPEGSFVILPMLIILYFGKWTLSPPDGPDRKTWVFPAIGMIAIWQIFTVMSGSQGMLGDVLRAAWVSLKSGYLNLDAVYWTARFAARQVIDPGVWGLITPIGLILVIACWREVFSRKNDALWFLMLPAVVAGLSIFAYYYLMSFQQDIQYLLGTSVNRLFMPVWVVGFLGLLATQGPEPILEP